MEELSARGFFDALAGEYHLLLDDWWEAAETHGRIIGGLLREHGVPPGEGLLDCTCGIGTQALPLARQGYRVLGTDLSAAAIARARKEAKERGIQVELAVSDVRQVHRLVPSPVEAVIACDNSFAHLLTKDDLRAALRSVRACLAPGRLFLASIRDYDRLSEERPTGVVPLTYPTGGPRRIVGQAWEWSESAEALLIRLFILREEHDDWSCSLWATRLRAWRRHEVDSALGVAGFHDIVWHFPDDSGYYQPIVTARAM
ncbi:MAG TPA: class I SAM-dependent methyltransferase [Actinomycetota bacterium]|jgi:cyclopropane fatty-acyl-phospholipid synthase-like methyltransferase|nr:class I SAM-dependent methyltransferase [Actinomycetota bacterium]